MKGERALANRGKRKEGWGLSSRISGAADPNRERELTEEYGALYLLASWKG